MKTSRPVMITVALATTLFTVFGVTAANAAGAGYGDVSDAMVYGPTAPLGSPLPDLIDEDDGVETVAAPWAMNFFGIKYNFLCITSNGTISPVLTSMDVCSDRADRDLENLALSSEEPVIAALAVDLHPDADLWVPGVSIATFEVVDGVATVTTTSPHPFVSGDFAYLWFPLDDPSFEGASVRTVETSISPTSFTFFVLIPDESSRVLAGASASIGPYNDVRDDTVLSDGLADDGFGAVQSVYYGTMTIGGKPAFVVTWSRVPTFDGYNSPELSNTFQVVIIQEPTANAVTAGYDFTIQVNIGTATDNDDGYDALDGASSCVGDPEGGIEDCRWGVGWADFDGGADPDSSDDDTATSFELFAASPINSLVDNGGATALVRNRLNSEVLGRYTWQMIGGVTTGFVVPTMNGADAGLGLAGPGLAGPPELAATGNDNGMIDGAAGVLLVAGLALAVIGRRRSATSV